MSTSSWLREHCDDLAARVVADDFADPEGWRRRYGLTRAGTERELAALLVQLAERTASGETARFVGHVLCRAGAWAENGLPVRYLQATLAAAGRAVAAAAPDGLGDVAPVLSAAIERLESPLPGNQSVICPDAPYGPEAAAFLAGLLASDRRRVTAVVADCLDRGIAAQNIYLHIIQPAQYEVGRLWQHDSINVAREHAATAIVQAVMAELYPHFQGNADTGRRLVAACAGDELHELGIRMVADFFDHAGWNVLYLGANCPDDSLLATVDDWDPDLLALSATMSWQIPRVGRLLARLRETRPRRPRVIVGGHPFNRRPDLWRDVGADGFAADAAGAVAWASDHVAAG